MTGVWIEVIKVLQIWPCSESSVRQIHDAEIFGWIFNIFKQAGELKVEVEKQLCCSTWCVSSVHGQAGERHWPQAELVVGKATRWRRQNSGILGRVQRRHWDRTHHSCNRKITFSPFSPLVKYILYIQLQTHSSATEQLIVQSCFTVVMGATVFFKFNILYIYVYFFILWYCNTDLNNDTDIYQKLFGL